ncbi:hypothetical protein HDU97_008744 [Phlyctochytrium planicorne]|nr:hypothetical protein HDU97_008744 [Phlyctochytrium planicorne]
MASVDETVHEKEKEETAVATNGGESFRMLDPSEDTEAELNLVTSNVLRALSPEPDSDEDDNMIPFQFRVGPNGVLHARLHGMPKFSDGNPEKFPTSETLQLCSDLHANVRKTWLLQLGLLDSDGNGDFPEGFDLFFPLDPTDDIPGSIGYLYGHESGRPFTSPIEFVNHLNWLILGDKTDACRCEVCAESRSGNEEEIAAEEADIPAVLGLRPASELGGEGDAVGKPSDEPGSRTFGRGLDDDDSYDDDSDDEDYIANNEDDDDDDDDDEDDSDMESAKESSKKRQRSPSVDSALNGGYTNRKRIKTVELEVDAVVLPTLNFPFTLRTREIGWYPTSKLHLNLGDETSPDYWPVLVIAQSETDPSAIKVLPLPLPSSSELQYLKTRPAPQEPVEICQDVDHSVTPGHYTPRKALPPAFPPKLVDRSLYSPFRTKEATFASRSTPRLNRAMVQSVGATTSFEILDLVNGIPSEPSVFIDLPVEAYVQRFRWGSDIIHIGDLVELEPMYTKVLIAPEKVEVAEGGAVTITSPQILTTRTLRVMELKHAIIASKDYLEVEGRVFQLDDSGEIAEALLGIARYSANKVLVGRWLGNEFSVKQLPSMPVRYTERPGLARHERLWEGWIGPDHRNVDMLSNARESEQDVFSRGEDVVTEQTPTKLVPQAIGMDVDFS